MHATLPALTIRHLPTISLALIVFGSRLWAFHYAGSPLPFFDQWLAEYNNVFLSLAGGHDTMDVLLRHHNEHVLFTTKLLSLLGFSLNGYWDVKFLVVCAALARAVVAVLAFRSLASEKASSSRPFLWLLTALIFGIPWSGFNALCGLQVSFYLAEIALLWSLSLVVNWKGPRTAFSLIGAMMLGLASLASALAIPAASLAVHWTAPKSRPGFWPAWSITATMALAFAISATGGQGGIATKLNLSTYEFFLRLLAWPTQNDALGFALFFITLISILLLKRLRALDLRGISIAIGLAIFALTNSAMLALNRQPAELHPRHWDTLLWMPLAFVALAFLVVPHLPRYRRGATILSLGITLLYGGAFVQKHLTVTQPYFDESHAQRESVVAQYRDWFLSGKIKEAGAAVNHQLEQRDYRFYDDPVGRYMPHPIAIANILAAPTPSLSLLSPDILPIREPSVMTRLTRFIIRQGKLLCYLGILIGLGALWTERKGRVLPSP